MEIMNYKKEFVKRTKIMLEGYYNLFKCKHNDNDLGFEVTLLMNCLLGLIITVTENEESKVFNKVIDKEILSMIPKTVGFCKAKNFNIINQLDFTDSQHNETNIVYYISHHADLANMIMSDFLKKLRNGIAHQNIAPDNEGGLWTGVTIWNLNKSGMKDFEIKFKIDELKKLVLKIADIFIKSYD